MSFGQIRIFGELLIDAAIEVSPMLAQDVRVALGNHKNLRCHVDDGLRFLFMQTAPARLQPALSQSPCSS